MVGGPLTQNSSSYHYICCRFLCSPLICLFSHSDSFENITLDTYIRLPIGRRMARRQINEIIITINGEEDVGDEQKTLYMNKIVSKIIWPQHPLTWNHFFYLFNFLLVVRARIGCLPNEHTNAVQLFSCNLVTTEFGTFSELFVSEWYFNKESNYFHRGSMSADECIRVNWFRRHMIAR